MDIHTQQAGNGLFLDGDLIIQSLIIYGTD